jgi:predicted  nucleic acid-binding Zn-ribbon protein
MSDIIVIRELAELDRRERKLRDRADEIPSLIKEAQNGITETDEELKAAKCMVDEEKRKIRSLELEIQDMNDKLDKYSKQLLEVKTNKEFQSLQKEMVGIEKAINEREDQLLETMESVDNYNRRLVDIETNIKKVHETGEQSLKVLKRESEDTEIQLVEVTKKRELAIGRLSPQVREEYSKIKSHYVGEAIVVVSGGVCTGCYVNIPPNIVGELQAGDTIIRCEQCGRFLCCGDEYE